MSSLIPLAELGGALMERFGVPSPGYHRVYLMITKGLLTPERLGGRIFFRTEDLPTIAKTLGIMPVRGRKRRVPERAAAIEPKRWNARAWSNFVNKHGREPSPDELARAERAA